VEAVELVRWDKDPQVTEESLIFAHIKFTFMPHIHMDFNVHTEE